ncbi:MAG TPA: hypothetical protein VE842_10525 [Pyrinomonadaceae bacterium]|nr:hypothetical protein [Pyrinomonadaceae bacterium]
MRKLMTLTIMLLLILPSTGLAFEGKSKKQKAPREGTPVLWKEPTDIESRDLFLGPGGEAMKPDLSSVTFIRDEMAGGYSVNYRVRDGAGKIWVAKLGNEAQSEAASVRLVWAVGYMTEINYLVPCVQIKGAPEPRKRVERCEGKGFSNVKFEARPEGVERLDKWSWANNVFTGTKEFQGMVVLMSLLNNWDLKDDNNKILFVPGSEGAPNELRYIISDLGATFGKTGGFLTHNRNQPQTFVKTKFVEKVEGDRVSFAYGGKNSGLFSNITVEQTKWIGGWLSRLSDKQIGDAFRAANYAPEEVQLLTGAVRARINQLVNVQG